MQHLQVANHARTNTAADDPQRVFFNKKTHKPVYTNLTTSGGASRKVKLEKRKLPCPCTGRLRSRDFGYRARMDPARTLPRSRSRGPSASASLAGSAPCVTALAMALFLSAASSAAICALLHSSLQNAVSPLFRRQACELRAPFRKQQEERRSEGEGIIAVPLLIPVHEDVAVAGERLPAEEARVQEMHVVVPRSSHGWIGWMDLFSVTTLASAAERRHRLASNPDPALLTHSARPRYTASPHYTRRSRRDDRELLFLLVCAGCSCKSPCSFFFSFLCVFLRFCCDSSNA